MEELFTQQQICEALQSNPQIQKVCFAPAVDSTNYWAKREATGMPDGTIFLTEEQSAGHGRFGRVWTSQAGRAIYASLLLRPNILPTTAPMLTLVMGLSVAQGISALTGLDCRIKWPNDIVIAGKKICGILTEMSINADGISHVIIGFGINVNNDFFSEELSDKATSLFFQKGERVNRLQVLKAVLDCFWENYAVFLRSGDLSVLQEPYQELLINRNREVRIVENQQSFTGIARGINAVGELLVERENGVLETVCAGEVSVRGLYSYT